MEVRRSALVAHPAGQMFDLIEGAERYANFLPWCKGATILQRDDTVVVARLAVQYGGVNFSLATRNPKQRPHWLAVHLEEGPFRRFEGEWQLLELASDACRIDFALRYEFDSGLVGKLAAPVFNNIAQTLVDAFVAEADRIGTCAPQAGGGSNLHNPGVSQ